MSTISISVLLYTKRKFCGCRLLPNTITLEPYDVVFVESVTEESLIKNLAVNILYPNPTKGYFKVNFEEKQPTVEMIVLDITGKLILEKIYSEVNQITADIQDQPSGNYVITLKMGEEVQSFILVKQK